MIFHIAVKLSRHHFDALNSALQLYIPAFINSNKIDAQKLEDRDQLSRRVLLSTLDDIKHVLQRMALRQASKKITWKLSEAGAIALYFILHQIPGSKEDHYLSLVIYDVINQLSIDLMKPSFNRPNHREFATAETF